MVLLNSTLYRDGCPDCEERSRSQGEQLFTENPSVSETPLPWSVMMYVGVDYHKLPGATLSFRNTRVETQSMFSYDL